MTIGVYKITNTINGKIYIGSCSYRRGIEHRWTAKYNRYLERSFKKYGRDKFKFEILQECKPEHCVAYEQVYLDYYKPWIETGKGYNISRLAGSTKGNEFTQEHRQKLSKAAKGRIISEQQRKKMSIANTGKKRTEEQKKKISIGTNKNIHKRIGENHPMFGKKHSSKSIEKMSAIKKGKKYKGPIVAVERIDPNTGEVKEYDSMTKVKFDNFRVQKVWACCKEIRKTHAGYYWQYLNKE